MAGCFHSALESSRDGANVVVLLDTGAVEAESQALNSMRLELGDGVVGQLGSGARSNGNFQPEPIGVVDQRVNVFATEGIASGQNQVGKGIAEADYLAQKPLALFGVEFERMRRGHGLGAAVFAGQTAGLSHLPVNQHGIFREVLSRAAHGWSSAGDHHNVPPSATPTSKFRLSSKREKGCD